MGWKNSGHGAEDGEKFWPSNIPVMSFARHWPFMQLTLVRCQLCLSEWMFVAQKNQNMVPALMEPELIFSSMKRYYNEHSFITRKGVVCKYITDGKMLQLPLSGTQYTHLTSANTVSDDSDGDGAMTTRGSPNRTSSQSIWLWRKTGQKHLKGILYSRSVIYSTLLFSVLRWSF